MNKWIRKMQTAAGGPIKYVSDIYLKLSDSPIASTIYDGTNLALYAAAPFTGGATLIPAMTLTGLQAGAAGINAYDLGLNSLNGLDIASAIPGFGLTEKGVKLLMKPTMKAVGKTTKRVKNATKYIPKDEKDLHTIYIRQRVGNSGSRRIYRDVPHTFNFGKYRPTFWLLAKEDKKYWPISTLVYGEDAVNHGLNTYQVVKDIDLKKQGGKMNILEFLKNGNKIKKALLGTNLDVDTRSDTTRQGRHEGTTYFGAVNLPNTWGILDWLNELDRLTNKSRSDSPIYNPTLNMGVAPSGSRGDLIWKYLHSFVTKHPQVLKSFPTIGKGFIKGNEMSVGQVVQPLEGLSVRLVRPLNLSNPVNNAAEKAAAEDFMKETGLVVNTKMPTGRPKGDYKYPQEILERTPKVVRKDFLNAKVTQSERYHDNRDFSKRDRTLDKNARAYESKKATPVNSGRSRVHENQNSNDWETLSKYKEYAKRLYKIQERLNKYPKGSNEYKQAFKDRKALIEEYRNKYRFLSGGVLDFLKNGSNIYIKPSKRGSFTKYCNGKVTEECIARGKRSPNAAIRKKATFAANSRKWSKN